MTETSDQPEAQPPEVTEADRDLGTLFDDAAGPDAATEARLWNRIQSELGPQSRPWHAPLTGRFAGGLLGFPARRVALVGGVAAVMLAAVLVVPSLGGGGSASAAILDAVDDLSEATTAALGDDDLDDDELRALSGQADELLRRIEDDPDAFDDLDLDDLSAVIVALQEIESLLIDRAASADNGEVGGQVGRAAQWVESALEERDPDHALLAATIVDHESLEALDLSDGRRALTVADAGSVVIDVSDGSLRVLGFRPNAGWAITSSEFDDDELEVWFTHDDGRAVELEIDLDDGLLATAINTSDDSARSDDDDDNLLDDDDDRRDDDDATATATPGATATPASTSTPGAGVTSSGTIPANQDGTLQLAVGPAGSVTIDVSAGLRFVDATPTGGWTIVEQEADDDDIEVRFASGTTEWRLDVDLEDDGVITWEVSRHLDESPSSDDSASDDDSSSDDDSDDTDDLD